MSLTQIAAPYPIFTDTDGTPLDDGYLYIGEIGKNPETNPIAVYWDAALTQPVPQPIRTNNGYPWRMGTPALLYTAGQFSITIRNKKRDLVLYSQANWGVMPSGIPGSIKTDQFLGDGIVVLFTLTSAPIIQNFTSIYINGVYQNQNSYSIVGDQLTFSEAPPANSKIEVNYG